MTQGAHENQQPAKGLTAEPSGDGQKPAKAPISAAAAPPSSVLGGAADEERAQSASCQEGAARTGPCPRTSEEAAPKRPWDGGAPPNRPRGAGLITQWTVIPQAGSKHLKKEMKHYHVQYQKHKFLHVRNAL